MGCSAAIVEDVLFDYATVNSEPYGILLLGFKLLLLGGIN